MDGRLRRAGGGGGAVWQVAALAVVWFAAAVVLAFGVKKVTSKGVGGPALYPRPVFFTALVNLFVVPLSKIAERFHNRVVVATAEQADAEVPLLASEAGLLVFIGCLQGIGIAMLNVSYQYLSLSNQRMIMACCILLKLGVPVLYGLETIGVQKWLAGAVLVAGSVFQRIDCSHPSATMMGLICGPYHASHPGGSEYSAIGAALVVASELISANRVALTQYMFQRRPPQSALRRWTKVRQLPYMATGTAFICAALSRLVEPGAFEELAGAPERIILAAMAIAMLVFAISVCELLIVSMTAATVMAILGVLHNFPVALAGVLVYGDCVRRNQWVGFALCTLGAIAYVEARGREAREKRHAPLPLGPDGGYGTSKRLAAALGQKG